MAKAPYKDRSYRYSAHYCKQLKDTRLDSIHVADKKLEESRSLFRKRYDLGIHQSGDNLRTTGITKSSHRLIRGYLIELMASDTYSSCNVGLLSQGSRQERKIDHYKSS
ncbi:hypothetical protein [Psychroflexus sp. MES1-P1E]|uniref:hypothetical protein n=1 Tax=Psychroflexus sp. MES1-P1E TaxID=2058320 RepID=UPI0011AE93FC|nr:hypothetical protein [Psychroflexus sp. MES1-P1E]